MKAVLPLKFAMKTCRLTLLGRIYTCKLILDK
jgi:hypothetical protein